MPTFWSACYQYHKPTWATMSRWQRKEFHRENETRVRAGKQPLAKP